MNLEIVILAGILAVRSAYTLGAHSFFAKPWHLTVFVTTNTWLSAVIRGWQ